MNRIERLKELAKKATSGPWYWQDRYDFREHLEHQKQGLNAQCENIVAGRISLESDEKTVLREWAEYADDSGLEITKDDAKLISEMRNTLDDFLELVEINQKFLDHFLIRTIPDDPNLGNEKGSLWIHVKEMKNALKKLRGEG